MLVRLIVQTVVWFGAMGAVMFLAAGTLAWPGAWVFLALMLALSLTTGPLLAKYDPGLLKERLSSPVQKGQSTADKIIISALFVLIFAWLALMGLDARFHWSAVPAWVQAIGVLGLLLSVWIIYLTFRENTFAAPVVKIQAERGHTVISTGPYAHVRHPMYFGAVFYFLGTSLLLGSWWGLAFAFLLVILLCIRIPLEEKVLRASLPGYHEYAGRVRYRLIPMVW